MPNDLPMLEWAGHSAAMGNAHQSVLAAVHEVALSDEGVAVVVERLLAGYAGARENSIRRWHWNHQPRVRGARDRPRHGGDIAEPRWTRGGRRRARDPWRHPRSCDGERPLRAALGRGGGLHRVQAGRD